MLTQVTAKKFAAAVAAITAIAALSACGGVKASTETTEEYPAKPIEFTIPMSAGGSTDILGRALAQELESQLGETLVVVNKPGAAGAVGSKEVLSKPADGYALGIASSSLFNVQPMFVPEKDVLKFDEMTVIGGTARSHFVVVANAESEFKTAADLLESDKKIHYGTAGVGAGSQISQAMLYKLAGLDAVDIPFEGNAPNVTALLGKQIDVATLAVAEAMPLIQSGKFTPLVTFDAKRNEFLPDVPTATELGYDVVVDARFVLNGPKNMPRAVVDRIEKALQGVFASDEYSKFLKASYYSRDEAPGNKIRLELEESLESYRAIIKKVGLETGQGS